MASQLELAKASLARLEAKYPGQDSPFKQGLRARIARAEKPRAENPVEMYSAGMRNLPPEQEN